MNDNNNKKLFRINVFCSDAISVLSYHCFFHVLRETYLFVGSFFLSSYCRLLTYHLIRPIVQYREIEREQRGASDRDQESERKRGRLFDFGYK